MATVFRFAAVWFALMGSLIALCALIGRESGPEAVNLIMAGLTIHISICFYFAFRRGGWQLNRVQGCMLLVILWVFLPLPVAISIKQSTGITIIQAYFEATSALTTTGASIFSSVKQIPLSVLVLRSICQWLGGLLTLMTVFMIIAPAGLGGLPKKQGVLARHEKTSSYSASGYMAYTIAATYFLFTLLCFLFLVIAQTPLQEAFLLSLVTVSSGGMAISDMPLDSLGGGFTSFILVVFMTLAGTSVIWQRYLFAGREDLLLRHRETYFYLLAIFILGIVYALTLFDRAGSVHVLSPVKALGEGFFTAASLVSTTGFEIRNGSFSVLPASIVLMIVLVGGCSFSTSGGITFYRIGIMFSHSIKDLNKLVYPNSVHRSYFGTQKMNVQTIKAVWTYFFSVTVVTMLGTLFLSLRLNSFEEALLASIAAFSNMGGFYATGWQETGQWTQFSAMDDLSRFVLSCLMILGRLHILALLAAFNKTYWLGSR